MKSCQNKCPILQAEIYPVEILLELGCDVVKHWIKFQEAMKDCPNMQVLHTPITPIIGCGGNCKCKDKGV